VSKSGPELVALKRRVGVAGAVLMGLGSILGTGVFVSLGLAAGIAGPAVLCSLVIAATLALFNGLSSAQLAATYPVSGGTYEYAYRTVGPRTGFSAGWLFMTAKSASAATAALGLAGYLIQFLGADTRWSVPLAVGGVLATTALVYGGVRRTNRINAVVVALTVTGLGALIVVGLPPALDGGRSNLMPLIPARGDLPDLLHGAALMFVAYTGYGRIATLGEEVIDPSRTIPRSIVAALGIVLVIYLGVAVVALGTLGADAYTLEAQRGAPLQVVAGVLGPGWLVQVVGFAAVTAMLGVLLNLVLGLSRVLLAMGRRADVPVVFARVDESGTTPGPAVLATGAFIASLVLIGDVQTTWSFSAFTVLAYYSLTNVASLRLPREALLYPRWVSWAGLLGCASLAVWIEPIYWLAGLGLLAVGHGLRQISTSGP
jgi:APA family basic amino acid/polyamine antiporter